jgi:hypothetical protein
VVFVNPDLRAAAQPVLDDLAACGVAGFRLEDDSSGDTDDQAVVGIVRGPDGSGTGITVYLSEDQPARIAEIAGVVQDIYIEDFSHRPWPPCPKHQRGGHPLLAKVQEGEAVWSCPKGSVVTGRVGELSLG